LINQNSALKRKLSVRERDEHLNKLFEEAQDAQRKANDSENAYRDRVDEYLKRHGVGDSEPDSDR
jgi:hypothetical protein